MTEDEHGRVYISYYNSIHLLDPVTDELRTLFPSNNFTNNPFGLAYFDNALWTGNGRRIDLRTLRVDTLFSHPSKDLGAVMVDKDSILWIGYLHWLYQPRLSAVRLLLPGTYPRRQSKPSCHLMIAWLRAFQWWSSCPRH